MAGLRWSFGLGPTDDLSYPWPVRLVTWLIVVQLVVVGSAVADRRSGENLGLGLLGVWGICSPHDRSACGLARRRGHGGLSPPGRSSYAGDDEK